jgi:hypothetical protein
LHQLGLVGDGSEERGRIEHDPPPVEVLRKSGESKEVCGSSLFKEKPEEEEHFPEHRNALT